MANKSDKELVKQFLAGDRSAFDIFVQRHQDRVYRLACARLYSTDDALDVAQEVFLRAYKGLRHFRFTAEPFTWLYRTLENVCSEYNRRTLRDRKLDQKLDEVNTENSVTQDGSEQIHMQQVRQMISKLPRRQQDVVLLRIFEGMSVDETATTLNCRQGTVKAHLHKAINNLRGFLDEMKIELNDYE